MGVCQSKTIQAAVPTEQLPEVAAQLAQEAMPVLLGRGQVVATEMKESSSEVQQCIGHVLSAATSQAQAVSNQSESVTAATQDASVGDKIEGVLSASSENEQKVLPEEALKTTMLAPDAEASSLPPAAAPSMLEALTSLVKGTSSVEQNGSEPQPNWMLTSLGLASKSAVSESETPENPSSMVSVAMQAAPAIMEQVTAMFSQTFGPATSGTKASL